MIPDERPLAAQARGRSSYSAAMKPIRIASLLVLCACGAPSEEIAAPARASLAEVMDRARESGALLVAAHRGGPTAGFPENALETLEHGFAAGIPVFEVDVAESPDGVLYLMHDRSLRRTGGHESEVADTAWEVVSGLDLLDPEGDQTGFRPPRLAAALDWAVATGALVELDRKPTTSFARIIAEVREAGAEQQVLLITYSDEEAAEVASLAPDLMMTAGVWDDAQRARLEEAGVNMTRVVAWMGTRAPDAARIAALGGAGIETAFGTLGRPGRRLDDAYTADGDASEYQALVDAGLTLLATDRPYFVVERLAADDLAFELLKSR